jgi:hypothetical protein
MPATETGPQPDTKLPSPAAASKPASGKRASDTAAPAEPEATVAETPEAAADAAEEQPTREPEPGWFRNTAATPLISMPDQYPSATLAPGEARWLPDDPRHPNLERCDAPAPDTAAADTTGSEK